MNAPPAASSLQEAFRRAEARPRRRGARLPGKALDAALMVFALMVLAAAMAMSPGHGARTFASACCYFLASVHLVVLALQVLRQDPPLFSARTIGLAGVSYWFLLEAVQTGGEYPEFGADHVIAGLALVQLYAAFFVGACDFFSRKPRPEAALLARLLPRPRNAMALTLAALLGGFLGIMPILVYGGGDWRAIFEGILASRSGNIGWGRSNLGDSRSGVLALAYFGWSAAGLGALIAWRFRGRWLARAAAALVLLTISAQLFFSGTRHIFAVVALPAVGIVFLGSGPRKRLRTLIYLALGLLILYSAFQIQRYARSRGFRQVEAERMMMELAKPHGHQLFIEVLYVTAIVPADLPYSRPGSALFFLVINPMPRALWPGKPVDPFWRDYSALRTGTDALAGGTTIASSNVGQLYSEGGFLMVILCGIWFGWWAAVADDLFARHGRRPEVLYLSTLLMTLLLLSYRGINAGLIYVIPATYILLGVARGLERLWGLPKTLGDWWPLEPLAPPEG